MQTRQFIYIYCYINVELMTVVFHIYCWLYKLSLFFTTCGCGALKVIKGALLLIG